MLIAQRALRRQVLPLHPRGPGRAQDGAGGGLGAPAVSEVQLPVSIQPSAIYGGCKAHS